MNAIQILAVIFLAALLVVAFVVTAPRIVSFIYYQLLKVCIRTPAKNTVTGDTTKQRIREFECRQLGCVNTAEYYIGMPQATCRRCGHKNHCAQPQVPEWRYPDD